MNGYEKRFHVQNFYLELIRIFSEDEGCRNDSIELRTLWPMQHFRSDYLFPFISPEQNYVITSSTISQTGHMPYLSTYFEA